MRTYSFAAAAVNNTTGILTTAATLTTPTELTVSDFDGAAHSAGALAPARSITVSLALALGAYTTDAWTFTGKRGGRTVTDTAAPTSANGNETLRPNQLFDFIESIDVPAQADTDGSYSVGVLDIGAPFGDTWHGVRAHAAGVVTVAYAEDGTLVDTLPAATTKEDITPSRIATAAQTVGLTVYY